MAKYGSALFGLCCSIVSMLFLSTCSSSMQDVETVSERGALFIIGGGDRSTEMMQEMIRLSGWAEGDTFVLITLPSGWGDSAYIWLDEEFFALTGAHGICFDSASVRDEKKLDALRHARFIFISGGDQNVMMDRIADTDVKHILQDAYQHGALIAGTSAGASIMSEKMISGNSLRDTAYASTLSALWKNNLELKEGLGLLDSIIIDQHFIVRSRYNRLISAVLENPDYAGVGIDEATALYVHNDSATVFGSGQVLYFPPLHMQQTDTLLLNGRDIRFSIFIPGEKFALEN
ncbi:MAG: cyanophycinase [Chitinophagales bacterium]